MAHWPLNNNGIVLTGVTARNWAGSVGNGWGEVNGSYRTNRTGAFYYHCSGHGGYIIDAACLSVDEYNALKQYIKPDVTYLTREIESGKVMGIMNPWALRSKRFKIRTNKPYEHISREIFVGEEDVGWAYVEAFTGIRHKESPPKSEAIAVAERWIAHEEERKKAKEQYKYTWIVVSAARSNKYPGMTECFATLGGSREHGEWSTGQNFLVPSDEYDMYATPIGFPIDLGKHKEMLKE